MLHKCLNLSRKSKKGELYWWCKKQRKIVEYGCHRVCSDVEYKKYSPSKPKKPIKKVSKNKETVSKETYEKVFNRCKGMCAICGTSKNLHLHHIEGRGRNKTDNPDNCIILCSYCHLEVVHKNNKFWRKKLKEMK